jgi:hypothetical protein
MDTAATTSAVASTAWPNASANSCVCADRVARGERARIALEIDTLMRRVTRHPNGKPESGYFEGVDDVLGILLTRIMQ